MQVIRDLNHLDSCPMFFVMMECMRVLLEAWLKEAPELLKRFRDKPYQEAAMGIGKCHCCQRPARRSCIPS